MLHRYSLHFQFSTLLGRGNSLPQMAFLLGNIFICSDTSSYLRFFSDTPEGSLYFDTPSIPQRNIFASILHLNSRNPRGMFTRKLPTLLPYFYLSALLGGNSVPQMAFLWEIPFLLCFDKWRALIPQIDIFILIPFPYPDGFLQRKSLHFDTLSIPQRDIFSFMPLLNTPNYHRETLTRELSTFLPIRLAWGGTP